MNTASYELCRELFELSGWDYPSIPTHPVWLRPHSAGNNSDDWTLRGYFGPRDPSGEWQLPAYELSFLLRKLPLEHTYRKYTGNLGVEYVDLDEKLWEASYQTDDVQGFASTPEDAVCKLTIELFKQGVLPAKT